jgi:hypothetical protein
VILIYSPTRISTVQSNDVFGNEHWDESRDYMEGVALRTAPLPGHQQKVLDEDLMVTQRERSRAAG